MNIESFEKWLIEKDNKTSNTAYSYRTSIPHLQNHYSDLEGSKVNFFQIPIEKLEKINEKYGLDGDQFEFGNKSKGTFRNALNALLRFRKNGSNGALKPISASDFYKMVDHESIEHTYNYIRDNDIELKPSTKFNVIIHGREFPPKDFLRQMAHMKGLSIIESTFYGGKANKPFKSLGYKVINTKENSVLVDKEVFNRFWIRYKEYFRLPESEQPEKYKWNVLKQVFDKWDWNSSNKPEMFKNSFDVVGSKNLWESGNFYAIAHTRWMFEKFEHETIDMFNYLFDENIALIDRIKSFIKFYDEKLSELDLLVPDKTISNHYHGDLRAIALYLTLEYPERYFLFKFNMVQDFCKKVGIPKIKKGKKENLEKYISISNQVLAFIEEDEEFLQEYRSFTNSENVYNDKNLHLLTQDFIYTVAKYFDDDTNYWRIGSNDGSNSYYTNMLDKSYVAIGWNNLGDLENQKVKDKQEIVDLLIKKNQNFKTDGVRTRKAGEIFNFYRVAQKGDRVVLMDGNTALAVGVISEDYSYDPSLPFSHTREVDWLRKGLKNFTIEDGPQTTFYPITKKETINRIKKLLLQNPETEEKENGKTLESQKPSLNQILFGPPGTGKTYKTKELAVNIVLGEEEREREKILKVYEELEKNQQILFTTFHQSMSYEDFIEGIKPNLNDDEGEISYEVQSGLFKNICIKALSEYYRADIANKSSEHIQKLNLFDDAWNNLLEEIESRLEQSKKLTLNTLTNKNITIISITDKGNLIVKPGKPNSDARDYIVSYDRIKKLFEAYPDLSVIKNIDKEFRQVIGGSNSTAYWSVLNHLNTWVNNHKNETSPEKEKIDLDEKIVRFQDKVVRENKDQKVQQYVLIIDEINRGNISSIFGELITLIEDDKRLGNRESVVVNLPYSKKEKFGVPPNLHIIGTMNTADRSVEALDTALRRRFSFKEILPDPDILRTTHPTGGIIGIGSDEVHLIHLLKVMNDRIEILIDKDHKIGHSYFLNTFNFENLVNTFQDKIIPLLEEYFYGDFGKIGLVLGEEFISVAQKKDKAKLAKFDYEDREFLSEKKIFCFTEPNTWKPSSFQSIYIEQFE